jgi:hypothetical protein
MTSKRTAFKRTREKKASAEKKPKDFGRIGNRQGRRAA